MYSILSIAVIRFSPAFLKHVARTFLKTIQYKLEFVIVAFRKRMAQVNIYYETLDTEVTQEKAAYDLNDFGCKLIMVT